MMNKRIADALRQSAKTGSAVARLRGQTDRDQWERRFADLCSSGDLPAAEREYRFHPTRNWQFDFAWPAQRVAVEIEGAVYSQGRHTRGRGYSEDCSKYNEATLCGWRVLRFTSDHLQGQPGAVLDQVRRALKAATE